MNHIFTSHSHNIALIWQLWRCKTEPFMHACIQHIMLTVTFIMLVFLWYSHIDIWYWQCAIWATDNGRPVARNGSVSIDINVDRVPGPTVTPTSEVTVNESSTNYTRIINIFQGARCANGDAVSRPKHYWPSLSTLLCYWLLTTMPLLMVSCASCDAVLLVVPALGCK